MLAVHAYACDSQPYRPSVVRGNTVNFEHSLPLVSSKPQCVDYKRREQDKQSPAISHPDTRSMLDVPEDTPLRGNPSAWRAPSPAAGVGAGRGQAHVIRVYVSKKGCEEFARRAQLSPLKASIDEVCSYCTLLVLTRFGACMRNTCDVQNRLREL